MAGNEGNQVEDCRLVHCDSCEFEVGDETGLVKNWNV